MDGGWYAMPLSLASSTIRSYRDIHHPLHYRHPDRISLFLWPTVILLCDLTDLTEINPIGAETGHHASVGPPQNQDVRIELQVVTFWQSKVEVEPS